MPAHAICLAKKMLRFSLFNFTFLLLSSPAFSWGFYAHQKINYYAVFLLPPQMMQLYKANIGYLSEHAVDPDKRRYSVAAEAPRHYIDIDFYGKYPYEALPHRWDSAKAKFGEDTLQQQGIVPWWVQTMEQRLTNAFKEKDQQKILKLKCRNWPLHSRCTCAAPCQQQPRWTTDRPKRNSCFLGKPGTGAVC